MLSALIRGAVRNPALTLLLAGVVVGFGYHAWNTKTVDAIPDISENQVVVVTRWPGRSPQDVEDQITYPLANQLAGVRGVKEVRGLSGFGFSQIYVVFNESIHFFRQGAVEEFYEARTRVLEKLGGLEGLLPEGVTPKLGPDATALGQIFWYTVEGPRDLATLRSLQDFVVRYELQAVDGVAEVASVGGMVRQYQVDVDPDRLRYYGVDILAITRALERSNLDVGAGTVEQGGAEFVVRGLGFLRGREEIEDVVVGFMTPGGFVASTGMRRSGRVPGARGGASALSPPGLDEPLDRDRSHRPLLVRDLGSVTIGPRFRRGALADDHGERVGGVVVARFGSNPKEVIAGVRAAIERVNDPASGILPEGVHVRPFYDRTQLITETVQTLEDALYAELVITLLVVLTFLLHLRTSLIIAGSLPLAVLVAFGAMEGLGIDSNIMSLTGIAIAIGTMVDMGIVMAENVYQRLLDARRESGADRARLEAAVEEAAVEVGPALLTAIATTVLSFVPIFFLTDMEGKLFRPLAWTKTLALGSAAVSGVLLVPVLCRVLLVPTVLHEGRARPGRARLMLGLRLLLSGLCGGWMASEEPWGLAPAPALALGGLGTWLVLARLSRERLTPIERNPVSRLIHRVYAALLTRILAHKAAFLALPALLVLIGALVAGGAGTLIDPLDEATDGAASRLRPVSWLEETFPGLGQEFMPSLDEGSLLYMPSLLPQASLSTTLEVMQRQNERMASVPEVARVVGKLGRAETALDPAPIGMIETVVILHPRSTWRPGLQKADLVRELAELAHTPGLSEGEGAWIQPIETRVIMLNSGIRAPMAVKLIGSPRAADGRPLDAKEGVAELEKSAARIREVIATIPGVAGPNVENLGGKPYLEVSVDRERAGHHGLTLGDVQATLMTAVGGRVVTRTLEGRERYTVRVAYERERRDHREVLDEVLVRGAGGQTIPLAEVARIRSVPGPAAIKTEDGRLRLHVTFAARDRDEGAVMRDVLARLATWRAEMRRTEGRDPVPEGVAIEAAGRYEAQQRARERFSVLIPVCLAAIVLLLYFKFSSWGLSLIVLSAVPVCVAGGLILLEVYPDLQDAFHAWGLWELPSQGPIYLTVAVIVGFIALAGIAVDDGVVMATYLEQVFARERPRTRQEVRAAVLDAGLRRIRPCLMTTFTTILALYPILASAGRGSDVAQPMAIPSVGGMTAGLISLFIVPCLYCWAKERGLSRGARPEHGPVDAS